MALETLKDIREEVLRRGRQVSTNTSIVADVDGFINLRYQLIAARMKWRWRVEERRVKISGKIETGTVAATNGSRTLTFTGLTLTEEMLNNKIIINNFDEVYRLIAIDTATNTAQMDERFNGTTDATATYTMFQDGVGLPPDFEEMNKIINPFGVWQILPSGPDDIKEKITRFPQREGKMSYYSIDGKKDFDGVPMGEFVMGYDFMGGNELLTRRLMFFPHIADEDYSIPISYIKRLDPLVNDTDEPLMPVEDRIVLVMGAMADLMSELKDDQAFTLWQQMFAGHLAKMEADMQDTEDLPRLVVPDKWRRDSILSSAGTGADLGRLFDEGDYW